MRFAHRTLGQRVVLDHGGAVARVRAELDRLEPRAVMVIGGDRHAALLDALAGRTALRWTEVVQHVPVALAERATRAAAEDGVDVVVAVGGGSAIGLAKAVALDRPVRIVAVPTTYAGSEATNVWGLTGPDGKRTGSDDRVLPETVVYDPELIASMPPELAAAFRPQRGRALRGRAVGPDRRPDQPALAAEGLRALNDGLRSGDPAAHPVRLLPRRGRVRVRRLGAAPQDLPRARRPVRPAARGDARGRAAVRASRSTRRPRRTRRTGSPPRWATIDALAGLQDLREELDAPRALRELGLREEDLPEAVEAVLPAVPPNNPRPVDAAALTRLLRAAWAGDDPGGLA